MKCAYTLQVILLFCLSSCVKQEKQSTRPTYIKVNQMKFNNQELINKAIEVSKNSYSPYSQFPVGVALVANDGEVYTGTNVENASYGLTICAERSAVFKAVAAIGPNLRIEKIIVYTPTEGLTPPCGACRQVINEFAVNAKIITTNGKDKKEYSIGDILPNAFGPLNLDK